MEWIVKYLDRSDIHCWELVRQVFNEHTGILLPEYAEVDAKHLVDVANMVDQESKLLEVWRPVPMAEHQFLDVVVMRGWLPDGTGTRRRGIVHTGIVPQPRSLLHTNVRDVSVCMPLNHVSVRNRIVGVYRHHTRCPA